ncbi:MAG TPA: hypothetical protein VFP85_10545 [Vicinamibacterales bacterium]|nr:hypothetical protein [Vicinamibacterales bacterium]
MLHLVTTALDARIRQAISQKRLVNVSYHGRHRVAEPHDYGKLNGADRLLIYQLQSKAEPARESSGWRLLDVTKIESLTILDATFKGSRSDARQSHHAWDVIYVRVE